MTIKTVKTENSQTMLCHDDFLACMPRYPSPKGFDMSFVSMRQVKLPWLHFLMFKAAAECKPHQLPLE